MTLSGIHYVTAIAGDPQQNVDFYTRVPGARLPAPHLTLEAAE